jgi:hypothetical protein
MKIILRIVVILLIASVVAGVFSLAVNNSSVAFSSSEGGQPTAMTDANAQSFQPMERPEGGNREGDSLAGGLAGVLGTLAKLTGITIVVLLVQKFWSLFESRRLILTQ